MGLTKQQKIIVSILVAGAFFVFLNQTLLSPAMPAIMAEMGVDSATVQWLTSGYALVEAIVIPLNAYLLGRLGARRLFVGGIAFFAAGTVVCGIAPSFAILMVGRVMQATATGAMMPATFTVILLTFPKERRGTAMGLVGLVLSIAPAIGPVLSGVLVDTIGWRYEFALITICALALFALSFVLLKGIDAFQPITFDILSVVLLAAGMIPLLVGLSTIVSSGNAAVPVAEIVTGIVILALFARRQIALDNPILKVETLKARRFCIGLIIVTLLQGLTVAAAVVFPIFAQNALGYSATFSGFAMLPGVIIGSIAGIMSGRYFDKHGARNISIFGGIMLIAGFGAYLMCTLDSPVFFVSFAFAVPCFGINLLVNPINTWGLNSLPNRDIAHGNAILSTMEQVGASLGTGLVVGLTALGSTLTGHGASAAMQAFVGCRASYLALFVFAVLIAGAIIFFVKDKN